MTGIQLARAAVVATLVAVGGDAMGATNVVELHVSGPEIDRAPLEASLREIVWRVGLALHDGSNEGRAADALAIVTIDVGAVEGIHVSVADGHTGHVVVERDIARTSGLTVAREDAVLVVRSALDALVEEARRPAVTATIPSPTVVSEPTTAPPVDSAKVVSPPTSKGESNGPSVDVGAFARAGSFASAAGPVFGGMLSGTLVGWSGPWHPALSLEGGIDATQSAAQGPIDGGLTVVFFRGIGSLALVDTHSWGLDVGLGLGGDVLFGKVKSSDPSVPAIPPPTVVDPVATGVLTAHAPIGAVAELTAKLGLDADLERNRLVVDRGGLAEPLFAPLPLRVFGALGLSFHIGRHGGGP